MTFNDLYKELLWSAAGGGRRTYAETLRENGGTPASTAFEPFQVRACMENGAVRLRRRRDARVRQPLHLQRHCAGRKRRAYHRQDRCVGCGACIEACASGKLTASRDVLPALDALKNAKGPVYAMVAPAAAGQFGNISMGTLRSAFKAIGFAGMVEVALFADILTLKEALIFDRKIKSDEDFMLTSCCCPIWIAMVRRGFTRYLSKIPDSVSPMVACGRAIKRLEPSAATVFIGPCIAKKAEAREKDVADAVDFVLTFEETRTSSKRSKSTSRGFMKTRRSIPRKRAGCTDGPPASAMPCGRPFTGSIPTAASRSGPNRRTGQKAAGNCYGGLRTAR